MNSFEQSKPEDNKESLLSEETLNLEEIKKDLVAELEASNNPNLEGIDYNELTDDDLNLWAKYKNYRETGSGLTKDEFLAHREELRVADIEDKKNPSSFKLSAYLVDKLIKLWSSS